MRAPRWDGAARTPDAAEESDRNTATYSICAPSLQAEAADRGWSVVRISPRTLRLTNESGSVIFASARRRHHANTLERLDELNAFARRNRR
jgi:hypothetical protein